MDPVALLRHARAAGLSVVAVDGRLVVRGPRRLAALAEALLAEKQSILAALRLDAVLAVFPGATVTVERPVWPLVDAWPTRAAVTLDYCSEEPPVLPCRLCRATAWHRAGSGWSCGVCHPDPQRLAQEWGR